MRDQALPATRQYAGRSIRCPTLQEAVIAGCITHPYPSLDLHLGEWRRAPGASASRTNGPFTTVDGVGGAEEMPDPLAELAEKTATDPGAPFMPEAPGGARGTQVRQPRRLRGAVVAIEDGRMPGDVDDRANNTSAANIFKGAPHSFRYSPPDSLIKAQLLLLTDIGV